MRKFRGEETANMGSCLRAIDMGAVRCTLPGAAFGGNATANFKLTNSVRRRLATQQASIST